MKKKTLYKRMILVREKLAKRGNRFSVQVTQEFLVALMDRIEKLEMQKAELKQALADVSGPIKVGDRIELLEDCSVKTWEFCVQGAQGVVTKINSGGFQYAVKLDKSTVPYTLSFRPTEIKKVS